MHCKLPQILQNTKPAIFQYTFECPTQCGKRVCYKLPQMLKKKQYLLQFVIDVRQAFLQILKISEIVILTVCFQLKQLKKQPEKKFRLERDSNP